MATINGVETNESFLEGTEQNDSIFGGMGDETVDGKGGSDLMDASGGNNILTGGTGADYFCVGAGDDTITDYAAEDSIFTEERGSGETRDINGITLSGNDVVIAIKDTWTHGSSNNRVTVQNAANKTITFVRNDYYNGNNQFGGYTMSKTTLTLRKDFGGDARAKADWGNAWRTLDARHYLPTITTIDGSAATKTTILYGNGNANTITGGSNNDALYGLAGNDKLYGNKGNDTIDGGDGNDFLDGGVGNDVLYGGAGNDTFFYKASTGKDTIGDYAAGELLSITGGAVSKAANSGNNVVFTVGNGTVTLTNALTKTVSMQDSRGSYTMSKTGLTLSSNFGGTMTAAQYLSTVKTINGKSATKALKLYGNTQANTITGGKGNDVLTGGKGKDTFAYASGTGKDTVSDFEAGETLYITSGTISKTALANKNKDLVFTVGKGNVTLKKAAAKSSIALKDSRGNYTMTKTGLTLSSNFTGTLNAAYYLSTITSLSGKNAKKKVTLYGNGKNNAITGGAGADYLYGGAGNDTLTGGKGNDTFVYVQNTGKDIVNDYNKSGKDTLYINKGSIKKVAVSGSNMVFTVGSGTITLKGAGSKTITVRDSRGAYTLNKTSLVLTNTFKGAMNPSPYFATITTINGKSATKAVSLTGNAKNNVINGGKGNDTLKGGAGNDKLYGNAGNDYLDGGAGNDVLYSGAGKDTLKGGAGNDVLYANAGTSFLYGQGGADTFVVDAKTTQNVTIYDFVQGTDKLKVLNSSTVRAKVSGNDVVLMMGKSTVTIKKAAGKLLDIYNKNGKVLRIQLNSGSQQSVMKNLMKVLDSTTKTGVEALTDAVRYASNGLYWSWDELVKGNYDNGNAEDDGLVTAVRRYWSQGGADARDFLLRYCGINLDNDDTGAITGYDAKGSSVQKNAEDIVPESGSIKALPTKSVTIEGLTFHWNYNKGTAQEKSMVQHINTWWAQQGLKLIEASYGLSFKNVGVTVKNINVYFEYGSTIHSDWMAWVDYRYYNRGKDAGKTSELKLTINMDYYKDVIASSDVNGKPSSGSALYLDRTLAHELNHAVMAANIHYYEYLPAYIKEGAAELVHGIDDFRTGTIEELAGNADRLLNALQTNLNAISDNYSAGYMLLRYLAYNVARVNENGGIRFSWGSSASISKTSSSSSTLTAALLADSSAMLAGSAEAQLSSLVSTATAGSLGALTTPGTGLASVDASGSSLVAANGVDSSNALTNKNKVL